MPVALSVTLLVATACGSGQSSGAGDGAIKVGASLPLSGPVADSSKPAYEAYKLWRYEVNEEGGLLGRDVELNVLDDGFDQNTVVTNYNRLIAQDRVDLLLGTFSSKLNLPASYRAGPTRRAGCAPGCSPARRPNAPRSGLSSSAWARTPIIWRANCPTGSRS